jgi:hypothetical protein
MSDSSTSPDKPAVRKRNGHFANGNPGGPGRPRKAVCDSAVTLDAIGADAAQTIVRAIVDKALAGDMRAAELVLSRAWPLRRGRPVDIATPEVKELADFVPAAKAIATAVMAGEITPHEGQAFSTVLETQRHVIEEVEIERRIKALEAKADRPSTWDEPDGF